jgi:transposase
MHRFIDGEDRMQQALLPHSLEDYVGEENPVRVIEVFIDELDLAALGFSGMTPAATGRPAYHPSTLLKIYLPLRLSQSPAVEPAAGTRSAAQYRADVADRAAGA